MWAAALLLALLAGASPSLAANFDTTIVNGDLTVSSSWEGGFCAQLVARNPGNNPSTSWAGLFTFSGGKLTSDPQGNGVAKRLSAEGVQPEQWTFTPTDPAQMAIFSQSPVTVAFCSDYTGRMEDVQASLRIIFSYDYKGPSTEEELLNALLETQEGR